MEVTRIITVQITDISYGDKIDYYPASEDHIKEFAEDLKDTLGVHDVVVTDVQDIIREEEQSEQEQ